MTLVQIAALVSFFNEKPEWLYDCLASTTKVGATHAVVHDGAYSLFPGAKRRSSKEEHEAIRQACSDHGLELTLTAPRGIWASEVAKRNSMFVKAERTGADWWFVLDADCRVLESDVDVPAELHRLDLDVAQVMVEEPHPRNTTTVRPLRAFFRAIPGLRVVRTHWTYMTSDGRKLWGSGKLETAHRFEGVRLEHRTFFRDESRHELAHRYYQDRDKALVEVGPCEICQAPSVGKVYAYWEPHPEGLVGPNGEGRLTGIPVDACAEHLRELQEEKLRTFQRYGLVPASMVNTAQNV